MTTQPPSLTVEDAQALLARMQAAAPPATAARLGEIAALLQSLSNDNAYLVGLYGEALILPVASDQPAAAEPEAPPPQTPRPMDDGDLLLLQLKDSLRPRLISIETLVDPLVGGETTALGLETKAALRQVRNHNRAAQALLDRVEMVVALRQGLIEVTPLVFSANMLLREAERHGHERAAEREQTISVQYPEAELQAIGDYQQILDVMLDLIDNASRYTLRGGHIKLKAESLGTHVLFSVEDNGIGLRPEDEARVGSAFWRAVDQPLVNQHAGTGLSLYAAKQLLSLQNGELICSGEPDMGSTFSFTLPAP